MYSQMILTLLFASALGCHPECRYQCSDPVCPAKCQAVIEPPQCQAQCSNNVYTPSCYFSCHAELSGNQCEADQCPLVTILCSPLTCYNVPVNTTCQILCEEPVANWKCTKPTVIECPEPECQLFCELPACESQSPGGLRLEVSLVILLILLLY